MVNIRKKRKDGKSKSKEYQMLIDDKIFNQCYPSWSSKSLILIQYSKIKSFDNSQLDLAIEG